MGGLRASKPPTRRTHHSCSELDTDLHSQSSRSAQKFPYAGSVAIALFLLLLLRISVTTSGEDCALHVKQHVLRHSIWCLYSELVDTPQSLGASFDKLRQSSTQPLETQRGVA